MGGVFVFGNGDPQQVTKPSGSLIWFSLTMMTKFSIYYLVEYISMRAGDGARVLDLINKDTNEDDISEVLEISH